MRVHLAMVLAVCIAPARVSSCGYPALEFPPVVEGLAGPSLPVFAAAASTAAPGSAVSQFCAGYLAGAIQGWKDLRGEATGPDGHVPQDLLDACPTPTCGSESYQDGFAAGRPVGADWARRYP